MARRIIQLACLAAIILPFTAKAGVVQDRLVIFGDSLSDTGNVAAATSDPETSEFPIPGPHYHEGRFSNGPVWVEHFAEGLGLAAPTPWLAGGSNYAFGGARTDSTSPTSPPEGLPVDDIPNMDQQVDAYLGDSDRRSPNRKPRFDLFVLWGGANDILFNLSPEEGAPPPDPSAPAANIKQHIADLHDAGGRNFLVPNLPRLGQIPLFRDEMRGDSELRDNVDGLALEFNAQLEVALDELERERPNINIVRMDVADFLDRLLDDPETYGIENVIDPAAEGLYPPPGPDGWSDESAVDNNPEGYLFWDDVHVSAVGHELLGDLALETILEQWPGARGQFAGLRGPQGPRGPRGRAGFTAVSTPEPTTLGLLLFGGAAALTFRRRPRVG